MTAMNPRRVNLRLSMLHLSRRPQWSRSCSCSLVLPGELPVTWLYGSGHNMGRTAAVISLLGPAGHPGSQDPSPAPAARAPDAGRQAMRMLLPRRSVRLRLTALYGVLFLLSGAALLAITSGVVLTWSSVTAPAPPPSQPNPQSALGRAQARIQQLQAELAAHGVSHQLLMGSAIALGIMTVASAVLGWIIAGRVLRPLRAITAATRRISADSLHERLALPGPRDELTDLADTIDGLLGRLEGAFAAQRRFAANAAHELRTPLTTMRASVDVAVAKPGPVPEQTAVLADRLRAELDQVDELLDALLALARA